RRRPRPSGAPRAGDHRLPDRERPVRHGRRAPRRERHRGRDLGVDPRARHGVSAWINPAPAAVFWAAVLLHPRVGEFADPWVWLSAGGGLLGAGLAMARGRAEGLGSLERAGLVEAGPRDPIGRA